VNIQVLLGGFALDERVSMLRTARPGSTSIASTHSGSESREGTSSSGGGEEAGRGLGDGLAEHGYGYGFAFAVDGWMEDKVGRR
jgi:hypothetical protein